MLCDKYCQNENGLYICQTELNEKGRCLNAENHMHQTDKQCNHAGCAGGPCDKPAQRGKLTKDDSKAGDTFLREAKNSAARAIDYFKRAAELYDSSDRLGDAAECYLVAGKIEKSQEYVRYIDRH